MLSSKLKSWVESHLTRKKSAAGSNSSSKKSGGHQSSHHHHHSIGKESPADRIAHPAASLVNLVPAVPLCSSSGRSNAGLVIRLQNDFAASSVASPCHRPNNHPSWTQSPVMLAWNTKKTQQCVQPPPPISPPPSAIIQQSGEPSPSGSDWTCKSFAGESGIGGSRTGNNGSCSSKATTGSSMCAADFCESGRMNAPSLSSPESAYSTGCSDGVSPSQDGMFDPQQPPMLLDWRRSLMDPELQTGGSGTNSSSTQSPRTRPAIRTNPWLPVRTSMTSSDRTSWMTDSTPEAALLSETMPAVSVLKETDIVMSDEDPSGAAAAVDEDDELDQLCNSLELLMDGDNLRVITQQPTPPPTDRRWDVDDQYTLLIRQTEEILLQLEKDELLLRNKQQSEEQQLIQHPAVNSTGGSSRPCSVTSGRRRLRKTAAMRRCSSRNSAVFSSSESSDCETYIRSTQRRMLPSVVDWNNRRPGNGITPRFATRQNVRVLPHPPSSQPSLPLPPPPPPPPRDFWILGSQRTSCSPDDWTTEHDRPPSPAPMDPHCHHPGWPVQQRVSRSPSISSCNSSRQRCRYRQQQQNSVGSCPTSPAIRDSIWDSSSNVAGLRASSSSRRSWRQSMTREQQRLESQIAFLRRQLKDVTDDYYYDDDDGHGTPSSDSDSDSLLRLLK